MRVTVNGEAVRTSAAYSERDGTPLYTAEQWDEWGYNGTFQFRQCETMSSSTVACSLK